MQQFSHQEIVPSCLNRWKHEDERTQYFSDKFDKWILNIPDNARTMIVYLLSCFCYYPHKVVNKYLVDLHEKLIENKEITDDNTIYISIKSESGIGNSSNDYWVEYKFQNKISKHICIDDIRKLSSKQMEFISNIVIIDDCSGSGKTLTTYLSSNLDLFNGKNIFFITIHVMQEALANIMAFAGEKKLSIHVLYAINQDKAFSDKYFMNDDSLKKNFMDVSKGLKIPFQHILGYENSEGLFAFYNNTPNNTLGIFRYDTEQNQSIFPRKNDRKPVWWNFREEQLNRKKQNYYSKMR